MKQYSLARIIAFKTLPIIFGLLIIGASIILLFSQKLFEEQLTKKHEFNIDLISSKLDSQINAVVHQIENLASNELIINGLIDPKTREEFLPIFFRSFSLSISQNAFVAITDYQGRILSSNKSEFQLENKEDWKSDVLNNSKTYMSFDENGLFVAAPIFYSSFAEGSVVAFIDSEDIEKVLSQKKEALHWVISDLNGSVLYGKNELIKNINQLDERDWFYKSKKIDDLQIISFQEKTDFDEWGKILSSLFAVTLIVVIAASLLILLSVVKFSVRTFSVLQDKLDHINENTKNESSDVSNQSIEFNRIYNKFTDVLNSLTQTQYSKERIESLINSLSEKLILVDLKGEIVLVNTGLNSLNNEFFGKELVKFSNFFGNNDGTLDLEFSFVDVEIKYINEKGNEKIINWNRRYLKNEKEEITGFVFVGKDITLEKEIAFDLHLKNLAINETVNGVVIVDAKKQGQPIVYVNKSFELMTGYKKEEVLNRNCNFLQGSGTEQEVKERIRNAIKDKVQIKEVITNYTKNGELFNNELMITPIRDELGQVTHFLGVQNDVTERINQNNLLERAKDKAEESAKLKSEFLANMSHEIRTPMNGVIGVLSILLKKGLTKDQENYTNVALNSANSLLNIINDILDFSKIEAGKLEIEKVEFDLQALIVESIIPHAFKSYETGIKLNLNCDPLVPVKCIADPTRIRQVINNLVSNALKFSNIDQDEVAEVNINVTVVNEEGLSKLRIEVQDNGLGIPSEKLNSLFESFTQVDASTTRHFGGTGLGLSIVKKIANLMEGDVSVVSQFGVGSSFVFECQIISDQIKDGINWQEIGQTQNNGNIVLLGLEDKDRIWFENLWVQNLKHEKVGNNIAEINNETNWLVCTHELYIDNQKKLDELKLTNIIILENWQQKTMTDNKNVYHLESYHVPKDVQSILKLENIETERSIETINEETSQKLSGKRILLVEDNFVNQMVAISLLENYDLKIETANDGLIALKLLDSSHLDYYDVILMDCQMPNLDGYQTTQEIRSIYNRSHTPPIIAMTANAMQGDREKCIDAGMDDYISKPIDEEKLIAKLIHWI